MRAIAAIAFALVFAVPSACAESVSLAGTWRGTFSLPRPVAFSVGLKESTATVALAAGHAAPAAVRVHTSGTRVRFALPGRPAALAFDGRLRKGVLTGTVTQSGLRGAFTLRRGSALDVSGLGVYSLDDGHSVSVELAGGRRLLLDYSASEVHGLYRQAGSTWDVGAGLGVREPVAGTARFTQGLDLTLRGTNRHGVALPVREYETRFRSGGVTLAGTLTVPAAAGKHPAVALVHGSGVTDRNDGAVYASYFLSRGFAVLAYDKRGIAQSGGAWPGEAATDRSLDLYARDAEAAARFLAAQPEVDPTRVGLTGASQAGWIMPLAATRERAIRFLVLISGPAMTTGEQQTYQDLTTEGATTPAQSPAAILAEVRRVGRITEGRPGTPLTLRATVVDASTCKPIKGASVDVWHADASGAYSGVGQDAGKTFMRGLQKTAANGLALFKTVYPGWYPGRTVHIHMIVHLGGNVVHTGQLYFNDAVTDAAYKKAPYAARGVRSTRNANDSVYRNGGKSSLVTIRADGVGGYVASIVMGVHRS